MLYYKNIPTFMLQLYYDKNIRQTLANHRLKACNFIKKETLAQVFSCEFCEIYETPFFIKHHRWLLFNKHNFRINTLHNKIQELRISHSRLAINWPYMAKYTLVITYLRSILHSNFQFTRS